MSSRRRPLGEIHQPQRTPSQRQPSTPHALRALQERSGAKTRSLRLLRTVRRGEDVVRPDSARGVLRQLAKITAPATRKRVSTPVHEDKENERPEQSDGSDDDDNLKRPRLTLLDIEESAETSDFDIPPSIIEEDSEVLEPPTPSILLGSDDETEQVDPTDTFRVHDFRSLQATSENNNSRKSIASVRSRRQDVEAEAEDEDPTVLSERGRRAISEDPTGRLSRYSFGSIRMSDFGSELEVRRRSEKQDRTKPVERPVFDPDDYVPLQLDEDTGIIQTDGEILHEDIEPLLDGGETFQLPVPQEVDYQDATSNHAAIPSIGYPSAHSHDISRSPRRAHATTTHKPATITHEPSRRQTLLEQASALTTSKKRAKLMKVTRHGHLIPSLPISLIKRVAVESQTRLGKRKPNLGPDHVKALEQATDWFFDQLGEDLEAYSDHAGRKKRVTTEDMLLLTKRQRILASEGDLQTAAEVWLPPKIVENLDLPDQP